MQTQILFKSNKSSFSLYVNIIIITDRLDAQRVLVIITAAAQHQKTSSNEKRTSTYVVIFFCYFAK